MGPPVPDAQRIEPSSVPQGITSPATIRGTNFWNRVARVSLGEERTVVERAWTVHIGGELALDVEREDANTLRLTVPASLGAGDHVVTVETPAGDVLTLSQRLRVGAGLPDGSVPDGGDRDAAADVTTVDAPFDVSSPDVAGHDATGFDVGPDAGDACGNGLCDEGAEDRLSCPEDCAQACGDHLCTDSETACSCPSDCTASCGDGCCGAAESESSCPADCQLCSNGCTAGSCRELCEAGGGRCDLTCEDPMCACNADCEERACGVTCRSAATCQVACHDTADCDLTCQGTGTTCESTCGRADGGAAANDRGVTRRLAPESAVPSAR